MPRCQFVPPTAAAASPETALAATLASKMGLAPLAKQPLPSLSLAKLADFTA